MMADSEQDMSPSPSYSKLLIRIASGLILAPLALTFVCLGGYWFLVFAGIGVALACSEWMQMIKPLPYNHMHAMIGASYIAVFVGSLLALRMGFEQGAWLTIVMCLSVWSSDVGAYFTGKIIGGAKLAPLTSPKKTWAGLAGAMVWCGIMMIILIGVGDILRPYINTDLHIGWSYAWIVFLVGCLIGLVGQMGDLFISAYKRRSGIKDTGDVIPGHGGLLDRIDALLLVCPIYTGIVWLWLM